MDDTEIGLSILIVNWNGAEFLPNCLQSIVDNPPSIDFEIVVIDNGSDDGSLEWLQSCNAEHFLVGTSFTLIETGQNLGFGKANNLGVRSTSSKYVFFLNPDTVVRPNSIDALLKTLKSASEIGACVPKLLHADGSLQPSVWAKPTPLSILFENIFYRVVPARLLKNWLYGPFWDYSEKSAVPLICAAALMMSREVIDAIGGAFDEDFHMYGEDFELAVRITDSGRKLYFVPEAEIHHLFGQSSAQRWTSFEKRKTMERGQIMFERKRLPSYLFLSNLMARSLVYGIYAFRNIANKKEFRNYKSLVKLNLQTTKHFFFGP